MKPSYTNFDQIENDLKLLDLQRKVAWEELKVVKTEFKEEINPLNWIENFLSRTGKYGVFVFLRKLLLKK
ncbi:DUF6327 family protein [Xanthomarina sp. F1114]|uniref:DUF6327 family protein n=1 Tax=Xanthomarina sp. F1114 TaxID=2996019 RepID=UPI00225DE202|nr:DUF6327 family protein [Xanthomarina sp. F1114]MCX7547232.1 DUF6327 family protein [Xanthomarina sp. F1114]